MKFTKWIWMVPLLLLVTWIGARGLAADPLWEDEWQTIYNAGGEWYGPRSPLDIWTHIAEHDPWQTPGYFLLYAGWGNLVGWSAYAGRALSLLFGLLTIALLYRAGRDFSSHEAGWGAAAALATCGFFGIYLHEMRPYILYAFCTALAVWSYWRILNTARPSLWLQAAFVAGIAGLFYTHYFATLVAVAIGGFHVLFVLPRWKNGFRLRNRWRPVTLMGLSALLFMPWMGTVAQLLTNGEERPFTFDTAGLVQYTLFLFSNGSIALMGFIAAYGIQRKRAAGFVWFMALGVLGLVLVINAGRSIINQMRYVMELFPLLALVVGLGVERLARRGVRPVYVVAVWTAAGLIFTLDSRYLADIDKPYNYMPWDALAREITPYAQTDDTAVMLLPYPAYELVQRHLADYYMHNVPGDYEILESPAYSGTAVYNERANALLNDAGRLWVAYDPTQPPDHEMAFDSILYARDYARCGVVSDTPDIHLSLYAPMPTEDAPYHFGAGIDLSLLLPTTTHNHLLDVTLGWSVAESVRHEAYSIALHVLDASGTLVAQDDYGLPSGALTCHVSFIDIASLPAGEYSVAALVYQWQSGERLAANDGDHVTLGTFTR
ncbi:MAG: glycosyltransferase family 39 protein [Anaerolineae bacterium]